MSNNVANECSSLPFNGNTSAWDTHAMKRADVGSNSSRGARTLDAFEIQKALLAACGVDPSGMTRPPPRDQGSMMRMPPQQMRMPLQHQPGMTMMDQQAMESRRIRNLLLNFEARKRLAKTMMSTPNLGASSSNSNLMAIMMQRQQQQQQQLQQQQQMSPKEAQTLKLLAFQGTSFGPAVDGRIAASRNGHQPVKNNLRNSAA